MALTWNIPLETSKKALENGATFPAYCKPENFIHAIDTMRSCSGGSGGSRIRGSSSGSSGGSGGSSSGGGRSSSVSIVVVGEVVVLV